MLKSGKANVRRRNVRLYLAYLPERNRHGRDAGQQSLQWRTTRECEQLATQRSDTWSMKNTYEALTGKKSRSDGSLDRRERRELVEALRAEDTRRRLAEAKAFVP